MGGVDLDAHRMAPRPCVHPGRERPQRFGQHHVRPAVQDSGNLRVALHWHGGNAALRAHLLEPDPQFHHQCTNPEPTKPGVQVLRDAGGRKLLGEGAGREIVHHGN